MKRIYTLSKKNSAIKALVARLKYKQIMSDKELEPRLFSSIENNVPRDKQDDKKYLKSLMIDMIGCHFVDGFNFEEYFAFDLEHKSKEERYQYVGTLERYDVLKDLSSKKSQEIFDDKYKCYNAFKPYFKRELIAVSKNDFEAFEEFANEQKQFMVKPIAYSLGLGIEIVDTEEDKRPLREIFDALTEKNDIVCEELIYQDFRLGIYHPSSVNTIRFVTYFDGEKMHKVYALFRMGYGGSVIDNAFAGGLIASVDVETGIIKTQGYRNVQNVDKKYDAHPQSHIKIIGAQIPEWESLIITLEELVRVVPDQKLVGWDMALTDDGWVMVEGNSRPIFKSIQLCEGKGFRETFEKIKRG